MSHLDRAGQRASQYPFFLATRLAIYQQRHALNDQQDEAMWRKHVTDYHKRQADNHLCATECRLLHVGGREVLQLNHEHAPVLTPANWGEKKKATQRKFQTARR